MAYVFDYWSYYFNYLSMLTHLVTMGYGMDYWCGSSKLALIYSAQFVVLHAFCWAIPDRRYTAFVVRNRIVFGALATINVLAYFGFIAGGLYLYKKSVDGIVQMLGLSLACFQLGANSLMMVTVYKAARTLYSKLN